MGDLIKFCEIFTEITLTLQSVIYVNFFIKCAVRWSENSVRFEKSYGNMLPDGPNSVRFHLTVQCQIWHVLLLQNSTNSTEVLSRAVAVMLLLI